ncbi:amidohydrolase family protein [Novosphingobium sp. PY1]|uniref:amidohydrolase family protein n=1 Tax=Novosphingobium sp. PY1 TaxID=1882221 RepID=UPI001A8F2C78|nr:amidohydrolase family protein [Novosphingobium sp. PY1]GFM27980.1 amidohydrolase [Novosphingobium sp. PY1]
MQRDDLVIISTEDYLCEPSNLFDNQLCGRLLAAAPRSGQDAQGNPVWIYQDRAWPVAHCASFLAGGALAGDTARVHLRPGCRDVHARIDEMDANGVAASLCFGDALGADSAIFHAAPDKALALRHLRAVNDWHFDEWCMAYPGRLIPQGILPNWDVQASLEEIDRLARKGLRVIDLGANPVLQGLPPIRDDHWRPIFRALADNDMTVACRPGTGNGALDTGSLPGAGAWVAGMPLAAAQVLADWLQLDALHSCPDLRIVMPEGSIGWVPFLAARADLMDWRSPAWERSGRRAVQPSYLLARHFCHTFRWDPSGLANWAEVGEDNIAFAAGYPRTFGPWADTAAQCLEQLGDMPEAVIDKVTHGNAIRWLRHEALFERFSRSEVTVGALRARAAAKGVDTAYP